MLDEFAQQIVETIPDALLILDKTRRFRSTTRPALEQQPPFPYP